MRKLVNTALAVGILGTVALIVAQEIMTKRDDSTQSKTLGLEPNIGIKAEDRQSVCAMLNTLLSDEYLLYVKTQNYHWNVTGLMFNDLHQFFGGQYQELAAIIDMVAERIRALGGRSLGSMQEFIANSRLKEQNSIIQDNKEMLKNLLNDHEAIIKSVRIDLGAIMDQSEDAGTENFLSELVTKHEKMAWMLRSYLS